MKYTSLQIVAATNNPHKLSEIRPLIEPDFRIVSLEDIGCYEDLPETMSTLEGNSLQKASYVFERFRLPCFADDTGLEVEALGGAPGVYSARYAGPHKNSSDNVSLLIRNLAHSENRNARFRTVITLMTADGVQTFEGVIKGSIRKYPSGTGGFGYDPVFEPEGYSITMAEMSMEEKNKISHRGQAVAKLVRYLKNLKGK